METLKYVIEDSTIAELLGVQNFSSDESAVLELIKNSYDANAMNVTLHFFEDALEITDDGDGMNSDDIKNHWMHIGKSSKGYSVVDSQDNLRIQAGSKGVGRFALSRLGRKVKLISKKDKEVGVIWETDWNFSTLDEFTEVKEKGTFIRIINLREKWTLNKIKRLTRYLGRTYKDQLMKIRIKANGYDELVKYIFPEPKPGTNCRSNIILEYFDTKLSVKVISDEFSNEAKKYYPDIKYHFRELNMIEELQGNEVIDLSKEELTIKLKELGSFSSNLFFNLTATKTDKEKFLYQYLNIPVEIEKGVILYRNAFSISSLEGEKDWLGFGKRSRKSPAAASHPTGSWRVRENQLSGYVMIDKKENEVLQDLMNRQGIDENIYFKLFVEIILSGIKEFERYRQAVIRCINEKNKDVEEKKDRIIDKLIKNPRLIKKLDDNEGNILIEEIKAFQQDKINFQKENTDLVEKHRYDVRILNTLATSGIKATSIAHEINNDRNQMEEVNEFIVKALIKIGLWDQIVSSSEGKPVFENIPALLENSKNAVKKMIHFIDAILEKVEKKQFEVVNLNVKESIDRIIQKWESDFSWLNIETDIDSSMMFRTSKDTLNTIFENLILNSTQQNNDYSDLKICINIRKEGDELIIKYSDKGKGLPKKFLEKPRIILEPHETSRNDGHGLGMWIINNTIKMQNGSVINIDGHNGFLFEFTLKEIK